MCIALLLTLCAGIAFAQQSADEKAVWQLEHSYWEDVKASDLAGYRALWHPNFIGWPYVSSEPQGKEHVTDWLNEYAAKGIRLKSYSIQPAASRAIGNTVTTYYRVTALFVDKSGNGKPSTSRLTHTWLKTPTGWLIIGGMSAHQAEDQKEDQK